MELQPDFEDLLTLLERHDVRYIIVGGLAFIYHAKPRYTKDIDVLVDPIEDNRVRANRALAEFGSPWLLEDDPEQIVQIGMPPNRIDVLQQIRDVDFADAWDRRVRGAYGEVETNWIDLDSLIRAKQGIDNPRHQEDVRVLLQVRESLRRDAED